MPHFGRASNKLVVFDKFSNLSHESDYQLLYVHANNSKKKLQKCEEELKDAMDIEKFCWTMFSCWELKISL